MIEYMEALSVSEAEGVKRTIKDLFKQTCILQFKYDPLTLVPRENPAYGICAKHRGFITDYLSVLGCELLHDPQEHIFRISGDGVPLQRLSEVTTLLILIVKLIYKDTIMGEGLNATVTSLSKIREYGKDTNLINRKLTVQEWKDALNLMKNHQIIELPCAIANLEDDTPIYLYSTVNIYCASMDVNEIVKKYQEEVQRLTIQDEEEERETSEEDIHQDVY